jgi:hypothetical protein
MGYAGCILLTRVLAAAVVIWAGVGTCLAQQTVVEEEEPFAEVPEERPPSNDLATAFDLLREDWLDTHVRTVVADEGDEIDFDFEVPPELQQQFGPTRWTPGMGMTRPTMVTPFRRPKAGSSVVTLINLGPNVRPGAAIGAVDVQSMSRLHQARARRAVINAIARTRLGRKLARFLHYNSDQDNTQERMIYGLDGLEPAVEPPTLGSKLIPRLSGKFNGRSRTIGVTFVWRF